MEDRNEKTSSVSRKRLAPALVDDLTKDRDGAVVVRTDSDGVSMVSWNDDLDTREILAACGTDGSSPPRLSQDLDRAVELLLSRYSTVVVVGRRGGRRAFVSKPAPDLRHQLLPPLTVEASVLRDAFPSLAKWDVLVRSQTMARPRFVALEAVMPTGTAVSRHPHLLLRAKAASGAWRYLSFNLRAGSIDAGWDHGSQEGWAARDRATKDALSWKCSTFERIAPVERRPISPRRRILGLENELAQAFGSALVVDSIHTRQAERISVGPAARRLSVLGSMYGKPGTKDIVAIVDGGRRDFREHVMKLASDAGMLVAVETAIRSRAGNRPLTSS